MNANRQHKMEREIMFRGKRTDTGNNAMWKYGSLIDYNMPGAPYRRGIRDRYYGVLYPVASETIGQFTGKKDLKGREIYEHDIYFDEVELDTGDRREYYICVWVDEWSRFVWLHIGEYVEYIDNGVDYIEEHNEGMMNTFGLNIERMHYAGNIHDNSELLKTAQP